MLDNSTMEIYTKQLHLAILLRSVMPSSGIRKFLYDFRCLNRALDNSTINSNRVICIEVLGCKCTNFWWHSSDTMIHKQFWSVPQEFWNLVIVCLAYIQGLNIGFFISVTRKDNFNWIYTLTKYVHRPFYDGT